MLENDTARIFGKILIGSIFGEYGPVSPQNEAFIKLFRISSLSFNFFTFNTQGVLLFRADPILEK